MPEATERPDPLAQLDELFAQLNDADAKRSLHLRLRLERLKAREDAEERSFFPDAYGGGGDYGRPGVSEGDDDGAPKGRRTLLDSLGISRRAFAAGESSAGEALTLGEDSDAYLREIEWHSAAHRHARALHHAERMLKASVVARETLSEGNLPFCVARRDFESRWRWHRGRARGALERFSRVEDCGRERVSSWCSGCGAAHEVPSRCGTGRICLACRNAQRKKRHGRFASAQARVLAQAERLGLLKDRLRQRRFLRLEDDGSLRQVARGYSERWSEKMITLTVPHVGRTEDDAVTERIRLLFDAWESFARDLREYVQRIDRRGAMAWYRAFEWTDGTGKDGSGDGFGHPHFHLWFFGPYIPLELVRAWWSRALLAAGLDRRELISRRLEWAGEGDQAGEWCLELRGDAGRSPRVPGKCKKHSVEQRTYKRPRRPARCAGEPNRAPAWAMVDIVAAYAGGIGAEVTKGTMRVLGAEGQAVQRYIEGWSLLDVTQTGEKIPAVILARVYEALDRRRLTSTSIRLLAREREGCGSCGARQTVRVEVFDPVLRAASCRAPKMRGPPRAPPG